MWFVGAWSWRHGLAFWGLMLSVAYGKDEGDVYERKVDLPQSGSPRRRMVTVGGLSMDRFRWRSSTSSLLASVLPSSLSPFGLQLFAKP